MTFRATTTVLVESATLSTDDYGDETETWAAVTGAPVPAAFAERSKKVYDPASGRLGSLTYGEALLPASLAVTEGMRLTDQTSGEVHHVTHVHRPQNLIYPGGFLRVETTDTDG